MSYIRNILARGFARCHHDNIVALLLLAMLTMTGCKSGSNERSNFFGLKVVALKEQITLEDRRRQIELLFRPTVTSSKYEFRLFFPHVERPDYSTMSTVHHSIERAWNGFEYTAFDYHASEVTSSFRLDTSDVNGRSELNMNDPISIWLSYDITMYSGRSYNIVLSVPSDSNVVMDSLRSAILVIGIGHDVFL